MKLMNLSQKRATQGNMLVVVMGTVVVLGIVLAAVLRLATQEHRIVARANAWNAALPAAESGIEEALSHLCIVKDGSRATNGWKASGSSFFLTNTAALNGARYVVAMTSATEPVILSSGSVWCPTANRFIERRVQVTTKKVPVLPGLVAKSKIEVQNSARADSFDSSNPAFSTSGRYDAAKYSDLSMLGALSGQTIVKDSAKVYGSVGSDTGTISVSSPAKVGTKAFVNGASTGLQAGHSTMDLSYTYPTIAAPSLTWTAIPGGANKTLGPDRNYKVTSYTGSGILTIKGKVVLYCTSEFHPTGGSIVIESGASLELYYGSQFYAEGTFKLNVNGTADQCSIKGVSGASEVYLQGDSRVVATITAPNAKMYLQDTAQFSGAGACNEVIVQGTAQFHFDEVLSRNRQPYMVTTWNEL
jgi:Tfp pilus assembly protein PilX